MKDFFESLGVNIGLTLAGFFGALAMIGRKIRDGKKVSRMFIFISLFAGVLTANYLTPLVVVVLRIEGNPQFGVAFLCGYLGFEAIDRLWPKKKKKLLDELES